jgi:uncharacterized membrane protein YdbT with pleckstrin-like domain
MSCTCADRSLRLHGRVAYSARLLGEGEEVVLDLRPHGKVLVLPVLVLLVVCGLGAYAFAAAPDGSAQQPLRVALLVVGVVVVGRWSLWPFLRWLTTHFVVTDRRVLVRSGVLARAGRDIALTRVNDVTFAHSLVERVLGCGTLVVESGGERGQVVLRSVPRVEQVQRTLYDLVEQAERDDDR